jgi:hypothetical protein
MASQDPISGDPEQAQLTKCGAFGDLLTTVRTGHDPTSLAMTKGMAF